MKSPYSHPVLLLLYALLASLSLLTPAQAEENASAGPKVHYVELKPPFVTNFGPPGPKLRFVKANITLKVANAADATNVDTHAALLRNAVVMLLSQQGEEIKSPEGQESLRSKILDKLKALLKEETGSAGIEEVLFTEFIIQR